MTARLAVSASPRHLGSITTTSGTVSAIWNPVSLEETDLMSCCAASATRSRAPNGRLTIARTCKEFSRKGSEQGVPVVR